MHIKQLYYQNTFSGIDFRNILFKIYSIKSINL
jgi:hypothetical protein